MSEFHYAVPADEEKRDDDGHRHHHPRPLSSWRGALSSGALLNSKVDRLYGSDRLIWRCQKDRARTRPRVDPLLEVGDFWSVRCQ